MSKAGWYLSSAIIANEYVKKKMTIGASNKLRVDFWRAWQCSGSLVNTGEMREKVDRDVAAAFETETYTTNLDFRYKAQRIYLEKARKRRRLTVAEIAANKARLLLFICGS